MDDTADSFDTKQAARRKRQTASFHNLTDTTTPPLQNLGKITNKKYERCGSCRTAANTETLVTAAEKGRILAHRRAHMDVLTGTDFFTVEVLTLKGLMTYSFLFFSWRRGGFAWQG